MTSPAGICCVCLEELHLGDGNDCTSLSCGHTLHKKCLGRLMHTTMCCPLCRNAINTDRLRPVELVPGAVYDRSRVRSYVPRSGRPAAAPPCLPGLNAMVPRPAYSDEDSPPSHATHAAGPAADPRSSLLTHLTTALTSDCIRTPVQEGPGAFYLFCLDVSGAPSQRLAFPSPCLPFSRAHA